MTDAALASAASDGLGDLDPTRVADRYEIHGLLGRGGMATAYRAVDGVTGKAIALKRLQVDVSEKKHERMVELFEREFHTLVQLAHPRVVQAHDYGVDDGRPYYTMELLDGGDLQGLAPLRWQDVCVIAYEICSALSLLHSRRLVHRDLTPRNIRRTSDGKAKLIDFGLLSPVGPPGVIAGTPPFVPPELVNSVSLDGRSDLFSLGATLYFVLTNRLAYAARRFDKLRDAWRSSPVAPSRLVPGIPSALDAIVMTMLRVDVGSRPKSAAEVMERLLPLLETPPDDELRVASAYLSAPRLVGRAAVVTTFRKRMLGAQRRRGGGFLISAEAGLGRSRILDAFVLEAKLVGATAVRASAADATAPFGVAATLAAQLHAAAPAASFVAASAHPGVCALLFGGASAPSVAPRSPFGDYPGKSNQAERSKGSGVHGVPSLIDITRPDLDRTALQAALRTWLLEWSNSRAIAIAVDDFDDIDEPSAALLASLTWEAPKYRLAYAMSVERGARKDPSTALDVVKQHAELVELLPLDEDATTELLASVFGETANLQLLSHRLFEICGGRPRECMELAQDLVRTGTITYGGGSWTLPGAIADGFLPANVEEALARQISSLGPPARRLGGMLAATLVARLSRAELVRLEKGAASVVDAALSELVEMRLLTGDTSGYTLRNGDIARLLTSASSESERASLHENFADMYEAANADPFIVAYHRLSGNRPEVGLDGILSRAQDSDARSALVITAAIRLGSGRTAKVLGLAISEAERLGRPTRDQQALWVMMAGMSAQGEDAGPYYRIAPRWLEQLKQQTGWHDWQALDPSLDAAARTMTALGAVSGRYYSAPEEDRALSPPDAIKQMVGYVVFSIAISVRLVDLELMASLPALLEPFAVLNPMVAAMLANARGTLLNGVGKREAARETFLDVLKQLDAISGTELAYVDRVRAAISQTLAEIDASLGVKSFFIERLDHEALDPNQQVGALYVKKVAALHQGDWEAAELHRQEAELAMLQSNTRPMFSTLGQELEAHAMARDLTGLKQVSAGIHAMASEYPGWTPVTHVADAHYLRLCGDAAGALESVRAARSSNGHGSLRSPWIVQAATLEASLLTELGQPAEAIRLGERFLSECERDGMRYLARGLACTVAEAEGKLRCFDAATARIEGVIAEQLALGVTGLHLGRCYELAAWISIWSGDAAGFARYAALTAEQYRPGKSSVLGALYERLMDEARQAGMATSSPRPTVSPEAREGNLRERATTVIVGCNVREERVRRALDLLCEGDPPGRGHLFLVTEAGLVLAASNMVSEEMTELRNFARGRLELEITNVKTMTAALEQPLETSSTSLTWRSAEGASYDALLLAVPLSDGLRLAGVAMLVRDDGRAKEGFGDVAEAVARALLESGDAVGIRAA